LAPAEILQNGLNSARERLDMALGDAHGHEHIGYRITTAVTNFFGSCPDCLEQGAAPAIAGSGGWLLEEGPGDDTIVL
jgi:hypothetical protein